MLVNKIDKSYYSFKLNLNPLKKYLNIVVIILKPMKGNIEVVVVAT